MVTVLTSPTPGKQRGTAIVSKPVPWQWLLSDSLELTGDKCHGENYLKGTPGSLVTVHTDRFKASPLPFPVCYT